MRPHALAVATLMLCTATADASQNSVQLGGLDVTVWSQEHVADVPQPVVVFSHGFHGCATQSRFLLKVLAAAGYLAFAPNHRDATCQGGGAS